MKIRILFFVALAFVASLGFAQAESESEESALSGTVGQSEETGADQTEEAAPQVEVPQSILNNRYYLQSVRLTEQAREAFETGNYDASANYAEQAAEQARLSDEYVSQRLADNAIARAHSRYTWAGSVGAARRYPGEYERAGIAYNEAIEARKLSEWEDATAAANRVLAELANVTGAGGQPGPAAGTEPPRPAQGTLPAQYTVRQWSSTGDCFSTIAGWTWVYGDPGQWRVLYDANRSKLPNPDNPHLIQPGMVLDIPSLKGETRSGMWDPTAEY